MLTSLYVTLMSQKPRKIQNMFDCSKTKGNNIPQDALNKVYVFSIKIAIFIEKKTHIKVCKVAKIRNRCNQVPHLTQDTNGKVTNSQLDTINECQEVSSFPADDNFISSVDRIMDFNKNEPKCYELISLCQFWLQNAVFHT